MIYSTVIICTVLSLYIIICTDWYINGRVTLFPCNYAAMKFIYAQSPHTMKGLLIGLFYCGDGVCSALAVVLLSNISGRNVVIRYSIINMTVALIGLATYTAAAMLYRKRSRDRIDDHYNFVVEYYTRRTTYCDEGEASV